MALNLPSKQKLLNIFVITIALLLVGGFFVFAWTEPTQNPPGGNVPAPINVGSTAQTKTGRLTLPELYLNATGAEGNIYAINQLVGYNDIFIKGNSAEAAPVYLAGNQIIAYTSGQPRLTITSSGNVGIGTTGPGYKLDVAGTIRAKDVFGAGGKNLIIGDDTYLTDVDTANMLGIYGMQNSDRAGIRLGSDGSYIFGDNGNIGIGTTGPGYKLTVNGSIGTPNMNHPYLVLDSNSSGSNNNEQSAQISLGESGRGSASLHLSYIGDGYSYIGMGDLGSDNIPDHWALRFYYQNDDVYAHNNINANDVYIRAIGKWASQLGGGISSCSDCDSRFVNVTGDTMSGRLYADNGVHIRGDWLRVDGQRGIYFQSYGGGWYMTDSTYIKNYGNKRVYLTNYLYVPRIYDKDNTSYYLDPSASSYLNTIYATGFYYSSSDISLKNDIQPLSDALEKILKLNGVSFVWKDNNKPSIGLIAQDVEKVFPELVSINPSTGLKSINYNGLIAPLIESIKTQEKTIEKQQKEIEELRAEINELKSKLK